MKTADPTDPIIIHLSARAVEWLGRKRAIVVRYVSPPGVTACGADRDKNAGPEDWCRVEDVRALALGETYARLKLGFYRADHLRPVKFPTCERCSVLLDRALETMVTYE